MGNSCGRNIKEKEIDKILQAEFEEEKKIVKLLLLGAAEGGKSTLLRQMKIIHDNGYDEEERCKKREAVYNNIVMGTVSIISGMRILQINYNNPIAGNSADKIMAIIRRDGAEEHHEFNEQTVKAIKSVWADIAVQKKLLPRRNEFQFTESYTYFMNNIERISDREYVPTLQDILMLRITTTGIIEVKFEIKKINFRVFDVGGQRRSDSYDDQIKYIEQKFESLNTNPNKVIFMHETCATDTNQIQLILENVIDLLIQKILHMYGLY